MNMDMKSLALFIFFAGINVVLGSVTSPTECYVCMAAVGQGFDCDAHVENELTTNCTYPRNYCQTVVGNDIMLRSCATENGCDEYKNSSSVTYCRVCNTDLCNTDNSGFVPSYTTSLVTSLALFSLMKLFA